jgi:hypothetical protein
MKKEEANKLKALIDELTEEPAQKPTSSLPAEEPKEQQTTTQESKETEKAEQTPDVTETKTSQ